MVQGQVLLKGRAGTFHIKFFQALSLLHSEIILPFAKLCHAFEEKKFSATIILWKKTILGCPKMNLKVSHKLR